MSATPGEPSFNTVCDSELKTPKNATFCCSCTKSSRNALLSAGSRMARTNCQHRLFVLGVGRDPAGVDLGLFERLQHELADAPDELGSSIVAVRQRPGAQQRLVQQVLLVAVGRHAALDAELLAAVQARPARERRAPLARQLGQHVDARAHVLAALGVVGRAWPACVAGQSRARSALWRWNAVSERPNWSGSPPTSLSEIRRL